MLAIEINTTLIPSLQLDNTVGKALQLIDEYKVSHLAVISEEKYLGLIGEADLLAAGNKKMHINLLQDEFINASIKENDHFLKAVNPFPKLLIITNTLAIEAINLNMKSKLVFIKNHFDIVS